MTNAVGIDTATADTAVAVVDPSGAAIERRVGPDPEGRPRHSELLLAEVESAVSEAGGWDQIDLIAVGLGPGSYTGLRIGIATARALAQSLQLPIVGVSSLEALARGLDRLEQARGRPRLPTIDARRGELFAALYGVDGEQLWPPVVAPPAQLGERLATLPIAPLAVGDGALRFRNDLEAVGATVPDGREPVHRIAARHLCELGRETVPTLTERIEPLYLRAPDAEVWLERDKDK